MLTRLIKSLVSNTQDALDDVIDGLGFIQALVIVTTVMGILAIACFFVAVVMIVLGCIEVVMDGALRLKPHVSSLLY